MNEKLATKMNNDEKKLSILEHLAELRNRLIRSLIVITLTTALSLVFYKPIFNILMAPAPSIKLQATEMTEMLGTIMRVSLVSGIMLAMPYLVYELMMFVSPALTSKEKKYVYLIIPWIALMFVGGVIFAYFILIPPMTRFLISFGSDLATIQPRIGNYVSLVTRLLLVVGLVFEMPVITTFLSRLGVIKAKWLADKRKVAIILAFVLAGIITPTIDPINQSLVAAPLIVLYEISIWLARLVQRRELSPLTPTPTPTP